MVNEKSSEEKQSMSDEKVGSLDEILDEVAGYACHLCGTEVDKDQRIDNLWTCDKCLAGEESLVEPVEESPIYKISGLSPDREKEAVQMLNEGTEFTTVMEIFGVARSDIVVVNPKR